jgi:hypothetical protein
MRFLSGIGGALGKAYDYATPGLGSNRLTDAAGWGDRKSTPTTPAKPPTTKPPINLTPAPVSTANNDFMKSLNAQIAALQSQLAYQPKLPTYDIMGNYNRARSQAEAAVNPLYDKYLNDFLAQQQVKQGNKRTETGLIKETNALDLTQTMAGNEVNRTRAAEDTAAGIEQLGIQEGNFQQASGTQNDVDRRALAESTAAAGLTSSGIGQGQIYDQNIKRNLDEGQQVQEFANQKQAKVLFKNRTFEDLARGDKDAQAVADNKNKMADFDLESYLQELSADESNFRNENEYKRLGDIAGQTQTYEQSGTQSFLSSLAGAGWRPQDIQLAYQIYG